MAILELLFGGWVGGWVGGGPRSVSILGRKAPSRINATRSGDKNYV